ncbi:MAG: four helix bundle protein [Bacteroidales bacterium]|nr:four helix bundle protein [Bacteroidales bacterium]
MNHKDLDAWKQAVFLAEHIYLETKNFPKEEQFGLISQIRRAAVSVSANIAEGAARNSDKQFIQFLHISLGSLAELETLIILSFSFGYIHEGKKDELLDLITHCLKLTHGLVKHLRNKKAYLLVNNPNH